MLDRVKRMTVARLARDITRAGMTRYFILFRNRAIPVPLKVVSPKPDVGNHFSFMAKM